MSATLPAESRPTPLEWTLIALLAVNLAWTTLCLGGYRPETMLVTSALNALLLTVHLAGSARQNQRVHPAGWLLLPFLAYAALNVLLVTPVSWLGWRDWLGWAQMIAVFWVVLNGVRTALARRFLLGVLIALGFVAVVMAAYQQFVKPDWLMMGRTQAAQYIGRCSGPFGTPNSLAALLILLIPSLGVRAFRRGASAVHRILFGYLLLVFVFGFVLTISRGAWLSLAIVLAVWPMCAARFSGGRRIWLSVGIAVAMLAIGAGLFFSVPLVRSRLMALKTDSGERTRPIMWRGAWRIFEEHPAWGGGAGSYNILFEKHRPENFQDAPGWAHNDYLNTLSDYGVAGFALLYGVCSLIGWRCWRASRRKSAEVAEVSKNSLETQALAVGVLAFAVQMVVDIQTKLPAVAMVFAVVAALLVQRAWPVRSDELATSSRFRAGWLAVFAAGAVVAGTLFFSQPFLRGETLRFGAREEIDLQAKKALPMTDIKWKELLAAARTSLRESVEISPANGAAWADLAYVIALSAHFDLARIPALGREAEAAANRALACSKVVPEFWVRRGVALDMQGRWRGAGEAFAEALILGPNRAVTWYNYAFHLGFDPTDAAPAMKAAERCLRLDPGNKEAQALRQRLATRARAP